MKLIVVFLLVFSCNSFFCQKEEKRVKATWAGQISLAKDVKTNIFLTLGGPNVLLKFNDSSINFGMFPSLRYNYGYDKNIEKTPLSTSLGTGVQYSYKHLIVGCLFYSVANQWYVTPSIGIKL